MKPFSRELEKMACYLKVLLNQNSVLYGLEETELNHDFNSCAVLLYHSLEDIKSGSSIGWHCDTKYKSDGTYSERNTIMYNTPIVIVTIGENRTLCWRKRVRQTQTKSSSKWTVDNHVQHMELDDDSICIINPSDEKPHPCQSKDKIIQYQHGNVSY